MLESADYEVVSAGNSDQGMLVLAREKPDLVVLDVIMSSVLDGLSMSQRMAEDPTFEHVPIVMVTSIANTDYLALFPDRREHPHRRLPDQADRAARAAAPDRAAGPEPRMIEIRGGDTAAS